MMNLPGPYYVAPLHAVHPLTRAVLDALLLLSVLLPFGTVVATARVSQTSGAVPPLVLSYSSTFGDWTHRFSPFMGMEMVDGTVYENLYIVSIHDNAKQYPMLATYYRWSADLKTLTFTIRQGVKWSDGRPFTPEDVAFSVMLGRDCSVCDTANLWGHASGPYVNAILPTLASVATHGHTVSLTFETVDTTVFASLVNNLWILPKHIWEGRSDPGTWNNPKPVGTGPFTSLRTVSSLSFELAKNPSYWQRDEPKIAALRVVYYPDDSVERRVLLSGSIDWDTDFLPNVANAYDRLNPHFHHYYGISTTPAMLYFNQSRYPYNLPALHQALSMAIDRSALANNAEYGYTVPSSGTGLEQQFPAWVDHSLDTLSRALTSYNPDGARALLRKNGFTYDRAGNLLDPKGHKVAFDIDTVNGWTDWDTACTIMAQNLGDIGIDAGTHQLQYGSYLHDLLVGDFDLAMYWPLNADTPYSALYNPIMSAQSYFPIGIPATFGMNLGRYRNPAADALLAQFRSTTDVATQRRAIDGLQALWLKDLPAIPLFPFPIWEEYNTTRYSGFPTAADYYASGRSADVPDIELVLLRVHSTEMPTP